MIQVKERTGQAQFAFRSFPGSVGSWFEFTINKMSEKKRYFKEVQKFSPHVMKTKVFMLMRRVDSSKKPWYERRVGDEIIHNPMENTSTVFHEAYVMELMDGIIGDIKVAGKRVKFSKFNWPKHEHHAAFQGFITDYSWYVNSKKFNLDWRDYKGDNVGYVSVEKDTFMGKKVSDYQYWHYQVANYDIYIPVGKYTIKRIDPDQMQFTGKRFIRDWQKDFEDSAKKLGVSVKGYLKRFALPAGVPEDKILHVPKI